MPSLETNDSGHSLTVQSNQVWAVEEAECAVQNAKLCSPEKECQHNITDVKFKAKLHQIRFRPWLSPKSCSPRPPSWLKGPMRLRGETAKERKRGRRKVRAREEGKGGDCEVLKIP